MKVSLGAAALAMPLPVWVIGSYSEDGAPDAMTAAWCGICCSEPPCVAVSLRRSRLSYKNIIARRAFTVNVPSGEYIAEVDYFGLVSGRDEEKFLMTGLTAGRSKLVDAPYIEEFPLVLECKVLKVVEIGAHIQFIGEIADVKADGSILGENGLPALERVKPLVCSPTDKKYYEVGVILGQTYSTGGKIRDKNRDVLPRGPA